MECLLSMQDAIDGLYHQKLNKWTGEMDGSVVKNTVSGAGTHSGGRSRSKGRSRRISFESKASLVYRASTRTSSKDVRRNSLGASSEGPEFNSQHPHGDS